MAFVVDASVALGWALEDETHKLPAQALAQLLASEAWAPGGSSCATRSSSTSGAAA
jgi:hypothetical protein